MSLGGGSSQGRWLSFCEIEVWGVATVVTAEIAAELDSGAEEEPSDDDAV